jgi:YVTN family beta-propeller protein
VRADLADIPERVYVPNSLAGTMDVIDPKTYHGLQLSSDARSLYVSNRLAGTISVINFASRTATATWPTGGGPDMMQISPDGAELWVSGRFASTV